MDSLGSELEREQKKAADDREYDCKINASRLALDRRVRSIDI